MRKTDGENTITAGDAFWQGRARLSLASTRIMRKAASFAERHKKSPVVKMARRQASQLVAPRSFNRPTDNGVRLESCHEKPHSDKTTYQDFKEPYSFA